MTTKTGLSDKAQLATDHYIANVIISPKEGYSWHQAMIDASYAASTVRSNAKETWDIVGVQSQIEQARAKIRDESVASRKARQEFWTAIMQGTLTLKDGTQPAPITMTDRLRASELLGRSEADFTDNLNTANDQQPDPLSQADRDTLKDMAKELTKPKLVKETA